MISVLLHYQVFGLYQVTFIGTVDKIDSKQTNITYTIRDDTGVIEVVQWIEGDAVRS